MTLVMGLPPYVTPEIIAQVDKGKQEQSKKGGAVQRLRYDGTKADVWS